MSVLKRLFALGGLTGLLAASAFVAPAVGNLKGSCSVHGEAKAQDKDDPESGVRLVGGEGKFTFAALTLVCEFDSNKDGIPDPFDTLEARATGWYSSPVCGAGKALGTITDITDADSAKTDMMLTGKKFGLQPSGPTFHFFEWHDPQGTGAPEIMKRDPDSSAGKTNDDGAKDYTVGGKVKFGVPANKPVGPPQDGECTKAFSVTGFITMDFAS